MVTVVPWATLIFSALGVTFPFGDGDVDGQPGRSGRCRRRLTRNARGGRARGRRRRRSGPAYRHRPGRPGRARQPRRAPARGHAIGPLASKDVLMRERLTGWDDVDTAGPLLVLLDTGRGRTGLAETGRVQTSRRDPRYPSPPATDTEPATNESLARFPAMTSRTSPVVRWPCPGWTDGFEARDFAARLRGGGQVPQRLSPLEVSMLALDTAHTPGHVGTIDVFEPGPDGFDYERLIALVRQRIEFVPRYRQRVSEVPVRLAAPVWVDDENFDLTFHVRQSALPRPGTFAQLREFVGRVLARRLDRSRPLWEMYSRRGPGGRPVRPGRQVAPLPGRRDRHRRHRPGAAGRRARTHGPVRRTRRSRPGDRSPNRRHWSWSPARCWRVPRTPSGRSRTRAGR